MSNSNSFNGGSACGLSAAEDGVVRSLPWTMRVLVAGFEGGWPA